MVTGGSLARELEMAFCPFEDWNAAQEFIDRARARMRAEKPTDDPLILAARVERTACQPPFAEDFRGTSLTTTRNRRSAIHSRRYSSKVNSTISAIASRLCRPAADGRFSIQALDRTRQGRPDRRAGPRQLAESCRDWTIPR